MSTGYLERKGNQRKMLPVDWKGRNYKSYPSIITKKLKIILNGNCLGDEHIYLSQDMLRESFPDPGGFSQQFYHKQQFFPVQSNADSIQIHYNGRFYWVTSTCVDGSNNPYDSVHSAISSSLQVHLSQFYNKD